MHRLRERERCYLISRRITAGEKMATIIYNFGFYKTVNPIIERVSEKIKCTKRY